MGFFTIHICYTFKNNFDLNATLLKKIGTFLGNIEYKNDEHI